MDEAQFRAKGDDELQADVEAMIDGDLGLTSFARTGKALVRSARSAGAVAVTCGRWLADELVDLSPRIRIRSAEELEADHEGLSGQALAAELVKRASHQSAALGAAAGALIGAEEMAPPTWLTVPVQLLIETVVIAVIEMRLIGELHEAYGQPVTGTPGERGLAIVQAWADRRGVTASSVVLGGGLSTMIGRSTRNQAVRLVRRRLFLRMGANLSALLPFVVGAVAGGEINRRATRGLGEAVMLDLDSPPDAVPVGVPLPQPAG